MIGIEILHKTEWLSLRKMVDPSKGVDGYIFSHEDRCNGHIVSILPFRIEDGRYEVLLREEVTPAWDLEHPIISSITGGVDVDESPLESVTRELLEEAGYRVQPSQMIELGFTFGIKSSDTHYHLYGVDLTWVHREMARGDGSELEAKARCVWTTDVSAARDPLVYASFFKLAKMGYLGVDLGSMA